MCKLTVVVGYGKSASDLITVASDTSKSSHPVLHETKWKIPCLVKEINMKYMLINRLGEAFILPDDLHNKMDWIMHKIGLAKKYHWEI